MKSFLKLVILISLITFLGISNAQEKLYTPLNIESAYADGTRSIDGKPGINYWQNSADYKIEAELIPSTRLLSGKETIKYYNNSPDTLTKIVIRLYQDFYRSGASRDFEITPDYITDGVNIESVRVNGYPLDLKNTKKFSRYRTNMHIVPADPVSPETSVTLEINWSFVIPLGRPIRTGVYDSTTFFIAYWYPQISVYDDIDGWDELNFGGEQEFYNDFNNYDVKITVPAGSGVWATGVLQNPAEVLNELYLQRYTDALKSDSIIRIVTDNDRGKEIFKSNNGKAIWHYRAENVTDFTFGISSHYLWDAVSFKPDPLSDRRTYIASVYRKTSADFYNVAEIAKKTLNYFSFELPGVPYPYPSLTVFNGSGGMEFPMMINNGSEPDYGGTLRLTSHEAAHQYFPFFVGTNERKYAWMDEGLAVMIPSEFQERNGKEVWSSITGTYERFAGKELELPVMIPSIMTTGTTYRIAAYNRPACAFETLQDYLGENLFRKSLQEFISNWNGRHPIPYDLFYTFDMAAGENLSWFWQAWFFNHGHPDLAIKNVNIVKDKVIIVVEKAGSIPLPVELVIYGVNGEKTEVNETAGVWKTGNSELVIEKVISYKILKVTLGNIKIPDVNRGDNIIELNANSL